MQLSFENLLLIDHYIENILNHINKCIIDGQEITYPENGFNLAYILSNYRIFNEEEHLSMMTKWKYDSNLDLESANWLIEYYLTGKEIIKSYLEDNADNIDNNYINILPNDIYIVGENNLEIENNLKIENNLEIENIDDLISVYPSNKKKGKIIINYFLFIM